MTVRDETTADHAAVHELNDLAFAGPPEAGLADRLRAACPECVSLVAEDGGEVVGHILFTPVTVDGSPVRGMALGPMAVRPDRQRQGVGTMLANAGIERMKASGCPYVIVLGHHRFYPRFGFEPASGRGLICSWDGVPDEIFMVLVLDEAAMSGVSGVVRYRPEFDEAV